jgi:hypothetical protein
MLVNFKKLLKTYLFKNSSCTHYDNLLHPWFTCIYCMYYYFYYCS